MINKLDNFFSKNSYLIFLLTLVFWIGFLPLLEITGIIELLELIVSFFITLSSFYFFYQNRQKTLAFFFVPLTLLSIVLTALFPEIDFLIQSARLLLFVLFFFINLLFLSKLVRHKIVNQELIVIAIAAYILIGLMSSILCWFTYIYYPGAYNIELNNHSSPILEFAYYSIVTMSTLGYGDILPLLPQSKSLALVITLFGQFYMAILVAFLIGKFLNQDNNK